MSNGKRPSESEGDELNEAEKKLPQGPRLVALYDTKTLTPDEIAEHLFALIKASSDGTGTT